MLKSKIIYFILSLAVVAMMFPPALAEAELAFPETPCDSRLPTTTSHLRPDMVQEDGAMAFSYGSDNNHFVSVSEDLSYLYINVNLLFSPQDLNSTLKLLAFDERCNSGFGFGPVFHNLVPGENLVTIKKFIWDIAVNGLTRRVFPSIQPRYLWVEVLDNVNNPTLKTYSYLIDLQNPQNPTGHVGEPEPQRIDPVIIVPGILGSSPKNGVFVIDPIGHVYDNLIETLEANGYERDVNLFTFGYDWRNSNRDTALLLRDKIDEVQGICQCGKVDIVAHSMGGLVAREYIQSGNYEGDVDQLMFLGTPHLGAPKAFLAWEGAQWGFSILDKILAYSLSNEAKKQGYPTLFEYIRERPISSVQELLPIYDYLRDAGAESLRHYPDNYPRNSFLENLNDNIDMLTNSGVELYNVIGDTGEETINAIRVVDSPSLPLWEHGYPEGFNGETEDRGLELGKGDGTVPEISSRITDLSLQIPAEHVELVTQAEGMVFKTFTGNDPRVLIDEFRFPNVILGISMLSPADFMVIAPDGKRMGKDFETGGEFNEIEGAFYSGFGTDDEFVTIPNPLDGEYRIVTQGTGGGGEYTVAAGYMSDDEFTEQEFAAQTVANLVSELKLSVDNSNPGLLEIRPADQNPPEIEIVSPEPRDYLRSENFLVNVDIQDTETGVFSQEIRFDDIMIENNSTVDLYAYELGEHILRVKAEDFVGNESTSEVRFRIIATIESTIADLERVYTLGWIDNKGIKNSLVKKMQHSQFNSFVNELEAQRGKHMTEQAYQLLREDVYWLLNN